MKKVLLLHPVRYKGQHKKSSLHLRFTSLKHALGKHLRRLSERMKPSKKVKKDFGGNEKVTIFATPTQTTRNGKHMMFESQGFTQIGSGTSTRGQVVDFKLFERLETTA